MPTCTIRTERYLQEALKMQGQKMQDHVEKQRTFEVRYSEQTRKAK